MTRVPEIITSRTRFVCVCQPMSVPGANFVIEPYSPFFGSTHSTAIWPTFISVSVTLRSWAGGRGRPEEGGGLGGCRTGEARLTKGYRLKAKFVIHGVGPVWRGGRHGEPQVLASCYRSSLELAAAHGMKTIAFPAISCGVYGYPIPDACAIAVRETRAFLEANALPEAVSFVCFDSATHDAYPRQLAPIGVRYLE